MLLLLLCLFQNSASAPEKTPTPKEISFKPLRAEDHAELGSFLIVVPEGLLYATDENITPMIGLTRATFIPNCSGIFFSKKEDWSFCGIVQFFPFQKYDFTPPIDSSTLLDCFSRVHFYFKQPIEEEPEVLIPPTLDEVAQTFTLGYAYKPSESHPKSVCIKKLFRNDQDAILLTIVATDKDSYLRNLPEIDAMQLAIQASGKPIEPMPMAGFSYLTLIGLDSSLDNGQVTALSMQVIVISVCLGIFGLGLLAFAIRLNKKKSEADKLLSEEAPPSNHAEPNST